jgi:hypothetical protein
MRSGQFVKLSMVIALTIIAICAVTPASAETPNQITYQGRLTGPTGTPVPDGPYLIKFVIYNASTAGTEIWNSGFQTVTATGGLFTVSLGASPMPVLPASIWWDTVRYLGIAVGADPEMTPRTRLTSGFGSFISTFSTYSYNATVADYAKRADTVQWSMIQGMPAGFADGVDNNTSYSAGAGLDLAGTTFSLAANGVTSNNILDEPGIAASQSTTPKSISSTTAVDVLTISLTIPAAGYIVVDGNFFGTMSGTIGPNTGWVQIDETSGGTYQSPYYTEWGSQLPSSASVCVYPGSVYRIYYKGSAGTYTFRMEAAQLATSSGANLAVWNPMMKATYYPTSYGTVATLVTAEESGQFEKATAVPVTDSPGHPSGQTMYQVDLRELEVKAAKAQAESEQAQRRALEAQLQLERAKNDAATANK